MPRQKKTTTESAAPKKTVQSAQASIPVYTIEGVEKGTLSVPKEITTKQPNKALLAQYMRVYLHNQRQGNASTKTRSEVVGSTRKIYRQKGTGKARHGDIKAPIFVGGGTVGGPKPRNFELKLNKKQKKQALLDSVSLLYSAHAMYGLDDSFLKNSKTKTFSQFLKKMNLDGKKNLLLVAKMERNGLIRSARNVENVTISDVRLINPYIILNAHTIMMTEEAFGLFEKQFIKK